MNKVKSPIDTGQKEQVAFRVREIMPQHQVWCEPYFLMGEVFFNKIPSKKEIINDADNNIINFYLMVKNRWEQLSFLMESTIHCDFFVRLAERIQKDQLSEDLHKAWAFWLNCQKAFVNPERWSVNDILSDEPKMPDSRQKVILKQLSDRLQNTYLSNQTPEEVIKNTDGTDTLFFLCPQNKKQWKDLEPLLPTIQGKFILHYEQKTLLKLVQKGLLYSDESSMPLGIGTNFKREQRLFD